MSKYSGEKKKHHINKTSIRLIILIRHITFGIRGRYRYRNRLLLITAKKRCIASLMGTPRLNGFAYLTGQAQGIAPTNKL